MHTLKIITSKEVWNNFIFENEFNFYSFLCSWEWSEIQIWLWKEVLRYGMYSDNILVWILPLIVNKAKRGTYLFAPHTPLIMKSLDFFEILAWVSEELKTIWNKYSAWFIRINSTVENKLANKQLFEKLGFINAPMHEHVEDTHTLNLELSEEELLLNIKKKDRYLINRAIKEGVEVVRWNTSEQIDILKQMHKDHSVKVWYTPFSEKFIDTLYEKFWENITTISTRYNDKVESILMTIRFGKTCVYYIASSDVVSHKFSPNYLCQWEAIKQAKADGCSTYNFWGVSPDDNPKHPIAWVTKFKRKFGGSDYSLLHAQDLVLSPKYYLNWILETFRRKKRGYYYKKPE